MNPIEDQLARLFQAAAQVPAAELPAMPFGLETRILAAWREGRSGETGIWDVRLLVRGLLIASAIMAISFWPALSTSTTTTSPFADFQQIADNTVPSAESP